MPTYKQWGFTDVINSVASLGTGAAWNMTGVAANTPVIEIDFGYKVGLKKIGFIVTTGYMGDYAIIGSNTPATGTSDAYVPANGDVKVQPFIDSVSQQIDSSGVTYLHTAPLDTSQLFGKSKFRYYRLMLIGPHTPSVFQQGSLFL